MFSQWLVFETINFSKSTNVWEVKIRDNKLSLGVIKWYAPWKKYIFTPNNKTFYGNDVLRDVARFIEQATADYQAKKDGLC